MDIFFTLENIYDHQIIEKMSLYIIFTLLGSGLYHM